MTWAKASAVTKRVAAQSDADFLQTTAQVLADLGERFRGTRRLPVEQEPGVRRRVAVQRRCFGRHYFGGTTNCPARVPIVPISTISAILLGGVQRFIGYV